MFSRQSLLPTIEFVMADASKFPQRHVRPGTLVAFAALLIVAIAFALGTRPEEPSPPAASGPSQAAAPPRPAPAAHDDACREYVTEKQRDTAAAMIRRAGYDCQNVAGMCPYLMSEGFTVWCNDFRYEYAIENHGGRW